MKHFGKFVVFIMLSTVLSAILIPVNYEKYNYRLDDFDECDKIEDRVSKADCFYTKDVYSTDKVQVLIHARQSADIEHAMTVFIINFVWLFIYVWYLETRGYE